MLLLLCFLLLAGHSSSSQQRTPPRDAAEAPAHKGTAVIKGRVLTTDGRPIRRARVTASAAELTEPRVVSTNSQGLFEIRELPAGRYTITAARSGYLRVSYGQRRPREGGRPLQIADSQVIERIELSLPRVAVVSGRVTDEAGEPLAGATVFAMQQRYFRGQRRLVPVSSGMRTDDTGQYRILSLEPGEYMIAAYSSESWPVETDPKQSMGFLPTYFGGTVRASDAQRVRLDFGQELSSIDIAMIPGRVATISGVASSSTGAPLVGERLMVMQEFAGPTMSMMFGGPHAATVNADGTFSIKNVTPGDYRLTIRAAREKDRPAETGSVRVTVAGADIDGVMLVTGLPSTVAGRVISDVGTLPPFGTQRPRVVASPIDRDSGMDIPHETGRVSDEGTFELLTQIGPQRLGITDLPTGWALKSVEYEGRDWTGALFDIRAGQKLTDVTIVVSRTLPAVSGRVTDEKGGPAEATVLLFPSDESKWGEHAPTVRTARPDQSGLFQIRDATTGDYLIVALPYVQDGAWHDPEFLSDLRSRASRLALIEGQTQPVALTVRQ